MAAALRDRTADLLAANAADVEAAERGGMTGGLLDRLRLTPERLADMAVQLEVLADTPEPPLQRFVRTLPTGERVFERRVPVGVIGAVFEARPNVTIDVASQVLKARSAAVLRTGAAALGSATALVELVIAPSLRENGVPAEAVQLVPTPGHAGADALVGLPDLVPLVVVRGSGEVTRRLSALGAAAGTRVLAHADGGGVLYLDAERGRRRPSPRMVHDSTDRLGVCNRLNLLLIDRPAHDRLWPVAERALIERGLTPSLPPHSHRARPRVGAGRRQRGARDGRAGRRPGRRRPDRRPRDLRTGRGGVRAGREGGDGVHRRLHRHRRVLERPDPAARRLQAAGLPETGINVDHTPGPRGPVTYPDLSLRQFVVLPPE